MLENVASLKLKTRDNQVVDVPRALIVHHSELVRRIADSMQGNLDNVELPLPEVEANEVRIAVKWLKARDAQPEYRWQQDELTGQTSWVQFSEVDAALLNAMDPKQLMRMMHASHYLGIESLKMGVAQTIAAKIRSSKSVQEIRDFLGEPSDLTPSQVLKIRARNPFYFYNAP